MSSRRSTPIMVPDWLQEAWYPLVEPISGQSCTGPALVGFASLEAPARTDIISRFLDHLVLPHLWHRRLYTRDDVAAWFNDWAQTHYLAAPQWFSGQGRVKAKMSVQLLRAIALYWFALTPRDRRDRIRNAFHDWGRARQRDLAGGIIAGRIEWQRTA